MKRIPPHLALGLLAAIATRIAASGTAAHAAETHPFTVHDLRRDAADLRSAGLAGRRSRSLFALRTTDLDANRGRNDLWLVGVGRQRAAAAHDAQAARTQRPLGPADGRRSTSSRPAPARRRSGGSPLDGRRSGAGHEPAARRREPRALARRQASRFQPRGLPGLRPDLACTKKRLDGGAKRKASGGRSTTALRSATGTPGPTAAAPPVRDAGRRRRRRVRRHDGMDADAPSKPFGGAEEFTFTPDGKGRRLRAPRDVGARRGLVDQLRPLPRAGRRLGRAAQV